MKTLEQQFDDEIGKSRLALKYLGASEEFVEWLKAKVRPEIDKTTKAYWQSIANEHDVIVTGDGNTSVMLWGKTRFGSPRMLFINDFWSSEEALPFCVKISGSFLEGSPETRICYPEVKR